MRKFELPEIAIDSFIVEDVIATSTCPMDGVGDNDGEDY